MKGKKIYSVHSGQAPPSHLPCPIYLVKPKDSELEGTSSAPRLSRVLLVQTSHTLLRRVDRCTIIGGDLSPSQLKASPAGALGILGTRMHRQSWLL